jgi:phenylpropionate dioxygenase-like ring-hydroxylating dioxygenase large terminal subunit
MKNAEGFLREQGELGKIWQLAGLTSDLASADDWIRSTLGGRSVFLQRFKGEIRGFENTCAHRGHPLRTGDKGNGPVVCGYHHWSYDKEGLAAGIPKCRELFGVSPRELGARLRPLEVATCGALVFARFPNDRFQESLEEFLGPGFDILRGVWNAAQVPYFRATVLKANWRLGHHISLDDYHIVAVHPRTFGKGGYLPMEVVKYYRFGRHSAYFPGADQRALEHMAAQCRAGTYQHDGYRILQFFPNLLLSLSRIGADQFITLQQYVPVAHDRTMLLSYVQATPTAAPTMRRWKRTLYAVMRPLARRLIFRMGQKIVGEDVAVCNNMQSTAPQLDRPMILGMQEERIGWYEENYRQVVGDVGSPPVRAVG